MTTNAKDATQEAFKISEKTVTGSTVEEVQAAYSGQAKTYDINTIHMGSEVHREAALICLKYIGKSKTSSVLDVATGTGAVPFLLRKTGAYEGVIDIMDANMEMLYVASKKELNLRCIICHWVEEDIPLPENSYDAVTCISCLFPNHMPIHSIKGLLKVVKRDGFLICNLRNRHVGDDVYIAKLQEIVDEWIKDKVVELVEVTELLHLGNVDDLLTQLYVYRKL